MSSSSRDTQPVTFFGQPCSKEDEAQSKYRIHNPRANKKGKVKFSGQDKSETKFIQKSKKSGLGTGEKNELFS